MPLDTQYRPSHYGKVKDSIRQHLASAGSVLWPLNFDEVRGIVASVIPPQSSVDGECADGLMEMGAAQAHAWQLNDSLYG